MFNSSTGYALIKKQIGKQLTELGFTRYKTVTYYRITAGDILQFINFQKGDRWLSDQMTFNIVVQGLFCPGCSFEILQPGGRIGNLLNNERDAWWHCDTEESTNLSMTDISITIAEKLMPFFNKTSDADRLYRSFEDPESRFLWIWQTTFIDKGYICLKAKQYKQAVAIFEANRPSKVAKFKTIKLLTEQGSFAQIDSILADNVRFERDKLKI